MQISLEVADGHAAKRTAAVFGKEAEALQQGVFVMSQRFFGGTKTKQRIAELCVDCQPGLVRIAFDPAKSLSLDRFLGP